MTILRKLLTLLILLSTSFAFAQQKKKVFNLDNKRDTIYLEKTGLLNDYPNCRLEQEDSVAFDKYNTAFRSASGKLHGYIKQQNFDFHTKDSTVVLMHKFHVNSKGEIDYCTFIARTSLSKRTTRRYSKLLGEFIEGRKVNYESETPFFICGHSRYWSRPELR